jgi:tetratricopeptide (TPR) repeat protein
MTWQRAEPQSWPKAPGVVVLEGQPGEARDAVVGRWLAERHDAGGPIWRLQCRPQGGGAWAGLATLIQDLLPSLRQCAQDLLRRHGRELCLVLPALRCELGFPQSLTDTADDDEKTRNYAADRAYRCLHGLIELLSEWHERTDLGPWSIACEHYDEANRSVLLFNIAQVHAQIGPYEDAIDYFGQAMAMDPNYSEYYNDRGAVYFKMGLLEHAERDYLAAIELSPPYPEVWTNLGQCYRAMDRMDDAVRAYTRALDLDPNSTLALVGRADAQFALDHAELAALADYDRALTIEPKQPLVLASRAIVHYECGRCWQAAADLDLAVELAPELAELYHNRAVALRELGRRDDAARDLRTYLELRPDAADRGEVQESLSALARA